MARIIKNFIRTHHVLTSSNKTNTRKNNGLERFVEDIVNYSDFNNLN